MPDCVDDLQFVVDFDTADHAFEAQERVADFARRQLPRIIEEVFDRHRRPGEVWRLPLLDLDLGVIAHDELEQQWEMRLRERLAEALQAQLEIAQGHALADVGGTQGAGGEALPAQCHSREQAQLDTLLYFLRHGHLPWHAPQSLALASPLGQLAHEVMRDSAQALVEAWLASRDARVMVMRAARQFSPAWLARLASALAGNLGAGAAAHWAREAEVWIHGFRALWAESRLPSEPAQPLLWQGLLTALWADPGVVDGSQPLQAMVQAVAAAPEEQMLIWRAFQGVARRALDGIPPAPTATLSEPVLRTCLAARVPALTHVRAIGDAPDAQPGSRSAEQARLHQRLQAWLPPNAHDDDPAVWIELLHAEPSWARQTLLQLGRSGAARQRMAQALPASIVLSLMALWLGPTELALLQAAVDEEAFWGPAASPVDAALRWERTISYVLLHPAPALFNGGDYLDTLIAQRSERESIPRAALLDALQAARDGGGRETDAAPLVQAWLRARRPAASAGLSAVEQRRARLELALSQGLLAGAEEDWFDALGTDTSWLQGQLRQAGRRPSVQRRIAREWTRLARTQLIGLWLPAPERAAVMAVLQDPTYAALAGAGETHPEQALWEDLLAHLMRLTPGSFFHVDAYVRSLRERLALVTVQEGEAASGDDMRPSPVSEAGMAPPRHLSPAEQASLQQEIHLVQLAAGRAGLPASHELLSTLAWRFVQQELVAGGRRYEPVVFPTRLARHLVQALHLPEPDRWLTRIAAEVARQTRPDTVTRIAASIADTAAALQLPPLPKPQRAVFRPEAAASPPMRFDELVQVETLQVANAGVVLAGAYLPRLFSMLKLTEKEAFVSPEAAERAVHLVHYLATGSSEAAEPQLALHKVLCGVGLATPLMREFIITPDEAHAIDGLLQAMIAHWKIIGQTSVAGLRESFLQRAGRLSFDEDDGWQLKVESLSYDMLLDHLPWGYSLHKFPWMERPLHVEWR